MNAAKCFDWAVAQKTAMSTGAHSSNPPPVTDKSTTLPSVIEAVVSEDELKETPPLRKMSSQISGKRLVESTRILTKDQPLAKIHKRGTNSSPSSVFSSRAGNLSARTSSQQVEPVLLPQSLTVQDLDSQSKNRGIKGCTTLVEKAHELVTLAQSYEVLLDPEGKLGELEEMVAKLKRERELLRNANRKFLDHSQSSQEAARKLQQDKESLIAEVKSKGEKLEAVLFSLAKEKAAKAEAVTKVAEGEAVINKLKAKVKQIELDALKMQLQEQDKESLIAKVKSKGEKLDEVLASLVKEKAAKVEAITKVTEMVTKVAEGEAVMTKLRADVKQLFASLVTEKAAKAEAVTKVAEGEAVMAKLRAEVRQLPASLVKAIDSMYEDIDWKGIEERMVAKRKEKTRYKEK